MDVIAMIILILKITTVISKKKYRHGSSSESIENLLYYKDCKHKGQSTTTTTEKMILRAPEPPPQPACPCPRMCCTMKCDCGPDRDNEMSFLKSPMHSRNPMKSPRQQPEPPLDQPPMSVQPQINPRVKKKKRPIQNTPMLPPIGGRRNLGFTRDDIKNLISKDSDIKKILKDLVSVTMKKVDLVELVKKRHQELPTTTQAVTQSEPLDYSEEDEEEV